MVRLGEAEFPNPLERYCRIPDSGRRVSAGIPVERTAVALMRLIVASRDQIVVRMWSPRNAMVSRASTSGVDVWCICPTRTCMCLSPVYPGLLFSM